MFIAHDHRAARRLRPGALAIGNFDGVHRGHRALLQQCIDAARALGGDAVALTFDPHPTRVLAPERASSLLMGVDRKLELLATTGLDAVVVQRFDLSFAAQTPEEFVDQVVLGLRAREVFVGYDFRFGRNREGTAESLASLGAARGYRGHVVEAITDDDGVPLSSSRVRRALGEGDLASAERLLGRRYDLDGLVVRGFQRGRTLGFPTANLLTQTEALPRDGVYAVRAAVLAPGEAPARWHDGVLNLGTRPTLRAGRSIEAHLFDFSGDLYGSTLRVEFVKRLRDEIRFDGLESLKRQIALDAEAARLALSSVRAP